VVEARHRRATLKLRELQFRTAFDPRKTVEIARAIVTAKIKAEGHRREFGQAFLAELKRTKTTDDVRHVEGRTPAGTVRGAGGPIHGTRCCPSNAGDAELCDGGAGGKDDAGCDREGVGCWIWVPTRREEAREVELGLGLRRAASAEAGPGCVQYGRG
jgi:hypothetical protein